MKIYSYIQIKNIMPNKSNSLISTLSVIVISIAIIIIFFIFTCNSEPFSSSTPHLEYYSLSTCPHCIDFNPVWKQYEDNCKGCVKYTVDKDENARKRATMFNITGYPTILVVKDDKVIDEPEDRTCGSLRDMCKKHGIPCTVVC